MILKRDKMTEVGEKQRKIAIWLYGASENY